MDYKSFALVIFFIPSFFEISGGDSLNGSSSTSRVESGQSGGQRLKNDGTPVLVKVRASILDIEEVNCQGMFLTSELYIQHFWIDPSFTGTENSQSEPKSSLEEVWIPDSYIVNARKFNTRKHHVTSKSNGGMERSDIISVTTKCTMEFSLYPFDHQLCSIELESYAFTSKDVEYKWNERSVEIVPNAVAVLPFYVMEVRGLETLVNYQLNETFSRLRIEIHLRRYWNTYLETFYVPMTFFVALSLLSLWMVYPRVSAVVNFFNISLVNIFLQLYQNNSDLPKIYYKTAMTAYTIICYVFIFLTLFLNVYILFYIKADEDENENSHEKRRERSRSFEISQVTTRKMQSYIIKSASTETPPPPVQEATEPGPWVTIRSRIMDKLRRNAHWTLLCAFLITKFVYWVTLLCIHYSYSM